MIYKTNKILYIFDLDGTILTSVDTHDSYLKNIKNLFNSSVNFRPDNLNIRYSILTFRPKMDKPLVWLSCHAKGLHPQHILTLKQYKVKKNLDLETVCNSKVQLLKLILNKKFILKDYSENCDKIIYIDNNLNLNKLINEKTFLQGIYALTLEAFLSEKFVF